MSTRRTLISAVAVSAAVTMLGSAAATAAPMHSGVSTQAAAATAVAPRPLYVSKDSAYSNIVSLQYLLNAYSIKTAVDGSYGPATVAAVKSFQSKHGLGADGSAGPATMKAMVGGSNTAVRQGWSNANTTKAVERQLVKLGYQVAVDGSFSATDATDVKYQQAKYKLPVTGVVDYTTWTYLFNPPAAPGTGVRKGPVVLVAQSGTGLSTWASDCGPSSFVAMELRLGRKPANWTDVAHRAAAISYARKTALRMTNPSKGTSQIGGVAGVTAGFHRIGESRATTASWSTGASAVRSGGVAMFVGSLKVAAAWNGRAVSHDVGHWITVVDYSASKGYLALDPSSQNNKPVWISGTQLTKFSSSSLGSGAVYVK